jgi:hypothetical protein
MYPESKAEEKWPESAGDISVRGLGLVRGVKGL